VSYLLSAGRRLKELGRVDAALRDGSLCWSKVRLVVAVATAATEAEWLQKAMTMTTDQLEHHVQSVREPIVRQGRVVLPSIPQRFLPWRDRRSLFLRAGYACEICGNTLALELHHRVEHHAGGSRDPMNLAVTCRSCHEATHHLLRRRQAAMHTT
jgi:5-methylcytosine-specific restriction endonuclease McrA